MFAFLLALTSPPPPVLPVPASPAEEWLAAHNDERAKMGQKPLIWSDDLAKDAAVWAKHLAETDSFEHAPKGKEDQGENLWTGTKGAFAPKVMVQAWIDEKALYKRGKFPEVATNGKWEEVGHYTQLIWHNSKQVGCARESSAESDYLVCRYLPAGNWIGQDAEGDVPVRR